MFVSWLLFFNMNITPPTHAHILDESMCLLSQHLPRDTVSGTDPIHVCSFEKHQCNQAHVWLKTHSSARSLCLRATGAALWVTRCFPENHNDGIFTEHFAENHSSHHCHGSAFFQRIAECFKTWRLHHFPLVKTPSA